MKKSQLIPLYKYRSLSGENGRRSVKEAIINERLFWQSPTQFNDPFDCIPVLYFGNNTAERRAFEKRAVSRLQDSNREGRRKALHKMRRQSYRSIENRLIDQWPKWIEASAVTCFSEAPDHPLMWGHYADSHRGICLVFHEILTETSQWFAFKVQYSGDRPRVNLANFKDVKEMEGALLHKSDIWAYEKEHRMIDWRGPPGFRRFPKSALTGVILGHKISIEDEKFVAELAEKKGGLSLFRASIDKNEYKINILEREI